MTKGKYAARAIGRREATALDNEIGTYQTAVKRLTAENAELRSEASAIQKRYLEDVRALKAQLREGLSPEVLALRSRLDQESERAVSARLQSAEVLKKWQRFVDHFLAVMRNRFKLTPTECMNLLMELIPTDDDQVPLVMPESLAPQAAGRLGNEGIQRITAARRSSEAARGSVRRPPGWEGR